MNAVRRGEVGTAVFLVIGSHPVLTARQTVQHPRRGTQLQSMLMYIKGPGPSREKSGIHCERTATGSPVREPTVDSITTSSTIRRGVRGLGRNGKSNDSPTNGALSCGKYWSIVAMRGGGRGTWALRNDGEIGEEIGPYPEPTGDSRNEGEHSLTGLPATSRKGEDSNTGTSSSPSKMGRGGLGYTAGDPTESTTGSTMGVTIIGRTETSRRAFTNSRSILPHGTGQTSGRVTSTG